MAWSDTRWWFMLYISVSQFIRKAKNKMIALGSERELNCKWIGKLPKYIQKLFYGHFSLHMIRCQSFDSVYHDILKTMHHDISSKISYDTIQHMTEMMANFAKHGCVFILLLDDTALLKAHKIFTIFFFSIPKFKWWFFFVQSTYNWWKSNWRISSSLWASC